MEWFLQGIQTNGMPCDTQHHQAGMAALNTWRERQTLGELLLKQHTPWFTYATLNPWDLRDHADPQMEYRGHTMQEDEIMCGETRDNGDECPFVGKRAAVGVHKYYEHGKCNPIKAVVVTNECPECSETCINQKCQGTW